MSKNNKHKKQNEPNEVFMQITNPANNEKCMLKIPAHFKTVLDSLMSDAECIDYRNSREILQYFCEIYTAFDQKTREDYEVLLNSKVAKMVYLTDFVKLALQMHKYYVLTNVPNVEKLGRLHIITAKAGEDKNWIAKASLDEAAEIGKRIKDAEGGKFYENCYAGVYTCFEETDD